MIAATIVDVCATCAVSTLRAAVAAAQPGTQILVHDRQFGGVIVRVPLTIRGTPGAAIVAGGSVSNTGVDVRAAGVTIASITFEGFAHGDHSGNSAALVLHAPSTRVDEVRFIDNGFALVALSAGKGRITHAIISSSDANADPIRFWRSPGMTLSDSIVDGGRDVFVSWSPHARIIHNRFTHLRYGLHNMFSANMLVEGNVFANCEIGTNFMYAQYLTVRGNRFTSNNGPSGYGIGLEDADDVAIENNAFVRNNVGVQVIDSPTTDLGGVTLRSNIFANNGSGLGVQSDARGISVIANGFVDNLEQVEVSGGASASTITWNDQHGGNYWSDYAGFDRHGTGIGEIPYQSRSAFESLLDATPSLQIFRYSAVAQAIDFAVRALAVSPPAKLVDAKPLMQIPHIRIEATEERNP